MSKLPIQRILVLNLIAACVLGACSRSISPAPVIAPYPGAPLEVLLAAETLSLTNNTSTPIYHFIVPSELLPVIEWAPCSSPDRCSPEGTLSASATQSFLLADLLQEDTDMLSVFWWQLDEQNAQSSPQVEWIEVRIP